MRLIISTMMFIALTTIAHEVIAEEKLPFTGEWIGQNTYGEEVTLEFSKNSATRYLKRKPEFVSGIELYQIMSHDVKKVENVIFYQSLSNNGDNKFVAYLPAEEELIRFELKSDSQLIIYDGESDKGAMTLNRKELSFDGE